MSIQSDVEILSIQAVEHYAKLHNLSEIDVVNLFHKHQVFEKIILQHEYLHQLDFSETVNYVEEIVNQDASDLVLYHGSNIAFDCIDLSKSHNRRDFGCGFYCTVLESQAKNWAHRLYMRNFSGGEYIYPDNFYISYKWPVSNAWQSSAASCMQHRKTMRWKVVVYFLTKLSFRNYFSEAILPGKWMRTDT